MSCAVEVAVPDETDFFGYHLCKILILNLLVLGSCKEDSSQLFSYRLHLCSGHLDLPDHYDPIVSSCPAYLEVYLTSDHLDWASLHWLHFQCYSKNYLHKLTIIRCLAF